MVSRHVLTTLQWSTVNPVLHETVQQWVEGVLDIVWELAEVVLPIVAQPQVFLGVCEFFCVKIFLPVVVVVAVVFFVH